MKKYLVSLGIFCLLVIGSIARHKDEIVYSPFENGEAIIISSTSSEPWFYPLDSVSLNLKTKGYLHVLDGMGREYVSGVPVKDGFTLRVGGALGKQCIVLKNKRGVVIDRAYFQVDGQTDIHDSEGFYNGLLEILYNTMVVEWGREANVVRWDDRYYHFFVRWLRDHVHTLKGMKYFYPELKSGIDLYADSQRDDGMIFDNYYTRTPEGSYWKQRFDYGGFYKSINNETAEFKRIPVENDVEFLFIEGIYFTWKATGDDEWMKSLLDHALKAVEYSTSDPYRWSEKYQLLKRGFTIDTWDFQNSEDAAISVGPGNMPDPMVVKPEYTRFGVMFGDNTGFAQSLLYLAEMLRVAEREQEAKQMEALSDDITQKLNELSWNGQFFTHHIPEDPSIERDLGVDPDSQVSLSNAYSLSRTVSDEQATAIIKTYRRIKSEMPKSSYGEWYTIYPPFERGFGSHNSKWEYMNGGVTTIVAGELAHGAFHYGFEDYGVDILNRLKTIGENNNKHLPCTFRGAAPEKPETNYTPLSLSEIANADIRGETVQGVIPWTDEGENDLSQFPTGTRIFHDIPFDIVKPDENGRKVCLGVSAGTNGYADSATLIVNKQAQSIYFLHATGNNYLVGDITLHYDDGTAFTDYIGPGKILNWWYPIAPDPGKQMPRIKVAWRGRNAVSENIGVTLYGLNNPNPEKTIENITFKGVKNNTKWMILGVTLSDQPVFFMPDMISTGIPDNWGAAAVVYAMVEGLAGIRDEGVAFNKVSISPRWTVSKANEVKTLIKYDASNGYVAYNYNHSKDEKTIDLDFTGNGDEFDISILMPENASPERVLINGSETEFQTKSVRDSNYVLFNVSDLGVQSVRLFYN